jgi:hypothetical protein
MNILIYYFVISCFEYCRSIIFVNFSTKFNLSSEISHQISAKSWILDLGRIIVWPYRRIDNKP